MLWNANKTGKITAKFMTCDRDEDPVNFTATATFVAIIAAVFLVVAVVGG